MTLPSALPCIPCLLYTSALLQGRPQPIERQGMLLDIPACLIISAAVMIPALACGRFKRWMGILAGALYIAYLVIMFTCFGVA